MITKIGVSKWVEMWSKLSPMARARIADPKRGLVFSKDEAVRRLSDAGDNLARRIGATIIDTRAAGVPQNFKDIATNMGGGFTFVNPDTGKLNIMINNQRSAGGNALTKFHEAMEGLHSAAGNDPLSIAQRNHAQNIMNSLTPEQRQNIINPLVKEYSKILGHQIPGDVAMRSYIANHAKSLAKNRLAFDPANNVAIIPDGLVIGRHPYGKAFGKAIIGVHNARDVLLQEARVATNPKFHKLRKEFNELLDARIRNGEARRMSEAAGHGIYGRPFSKGEYRKIKNNMFNNTLENTDIPIMDVS